MKIKRVNISDIDGFKLGNAENIDKGTGCTVIICEEPAIGGVDVRGGAPATRETDLLRSENTVEGINAVVLSGGSAFGLEAASGVMNELSERGVGFKVGDITVPIVCGASLFDLAAGDSKAYPNKEMGRQACRNAYEGFFDHGNRGAGTGASVGKLLGMSRAMKSGLGTFACADNYLQVGAVVAVNAVGDIYNGAGNIIAGLRTEEGSEIYGTVKSLKSIVHENAAESAAPAKEEIQSDKEKKKFDEKIKTKSEIAAAIRNAFTSKSKYMSHAESKIADEAYFSDSKDDIGNIHDNTGVSIEDSYTENIVDFYSSDELVDTISSDMIESDTQSDSMSTYVQEEKPESVPETESPFVPETNEADNGFEGLDPDMGYDIPFNTTIACLITNAKLSKSQCNKLASILHDAYARAIKPVHSSMDGDTIFVLTSAKQEVNFDAFAALATDVMQYAIIDGAVSARSAYGLPASCDIIR